MRNISDIEGSGDQQHTPANTHTLCTSQIKMNQSRKIIVLIFSKTINLRSDNQLPPSLLYKAQSVIQLHSSSHFIQEPTGYRKIFCIKLFLKGKKDLWIYFTLLVVHTGCSSFIPPGCSSFIYCRSWCSQFLPIYTSVSLNYFHTTLERVATDMVEKTSRWAVNTKCLGVFVVAMNKISMPLLKIVLHPATAPMNLSPPVSIKPPTGGCIS